MPTKGIRSQRDPAVPVAFEVLAVAGAAVPFATDFTGRRFGVLAGALVENTGTVNIRYRFDGTDPTTLIGHRLFPGQADYWNESEVRGAKMISEGAAAEVTMTAYREN